jgi:hypothetical protein
VTVVSVRTAVVLLLLLLLLLPLLPLVPLLPADVLDSTAEWNTERMNGSEASGCSGSVIRIDRNIGVTPVLKFASMDMDDVPVRTGKIKNRGFVYWCAPKLNSAAAVN